MTGTGGYGDSNSSPGLVIKKGEKNKVGEQALLLSSQFEKSSVCMWADIREDVQVKSKFEHLRVYIMTRA